MMKKITFLLAFLAVSIGYSQTVIEDFEGTVAAGTLVPDGVTSVTLVDDPATGGTRGKVAQIITSASGDSWQNAQLFFQDAFLDLSTSNKVVTVDVYSTTSFTMLGKVASPKVSGTPESATDAVHGGTGWETLTFNFANGKDNTSAASGVFGRILFFPLWKEGGGWKAPAVTTTYFDNVKGIVISNTCSNGVQDGDETGVDCGGSCDACPAGSASVIENFEGTIADGTLAVDGITSMTVVNDPVSGGTNGKVVEIITSATGASWQNAQLFFQDSFLDLSTTDKIVTVDVYSTTSFAMLAKVASGKNGEAESATDAVHGGTGWETLTFNFANAKDNTSAASGLFGRILFFPLWKDGGGWKDPAATTTYIDNVKGIVYVNTCSNGIQDGDETGVDCGGSCDACPEGNASIMENFEGTIADGALAVDGITSFTVVNDPASGGTNGKVAQIITSAAGASWQNAQLFFQDAYLDLSTTDKIVTVDVYSTTAFTMLAKVASPKVTTTPESATDAVHGGTGWETLTFNFANGKDNTSAASGLFGRILFFPLFKTGGGWNSPAVTTTYVDNITGLKVAKNTGGGGGTTEGYCEKVVTHFGLDQPATAIKLTVENSGEKTMKVTIESNDADPVDAIVIPAVTGAPTVSAPDTSVAGKISVTLTWETAPTTDIDFNINWSKVSFAGNWALSEAPVTVKFDSTCGTASVKNNTLLNVSMYPNPVSHNLNISAPSIIKNAAIYNVLGKQVMNIEINNNRKSIDVSNLSSGIYLIKYQIENAFGTAKFIKQ